jgi:hypothetical protein
MLLLGFFSMLCCFTIATGKDRDLEMPGNRILQLAASNLLLKDVIQGRWDVPTTFFANIVH